MNAPLGSGIGYFDPNNRTCPACATKVAENARLRESIRERNDKIKILEIKVVEWRRAYDEAVDAVGGPKVPLTLEVK